MKEKNNYILEIHNGIPSKLYGGKEKIKLEIRDYDTDNIDDDSLKRDSKNISYYEYIMENEEDENN